MYSNSQFLPSPLSSLGGGETPLGLLIATREEEEERSQVKFVGERKEGNSTTVFRGQSSIALVVIIYPKGEERGGEKTSVTSHALIQATKTFLSFWVL